MAKTNKQTDPTLIIGDNSMELNEDWAYQFVMWAYGNRANNDFTSKLQQYRGIDLGIIDEAELRKFFDPSTIIDPKDRANLMRIDGRGSPLIHSLNTIVQNNILGIPVELQVFGSDKLSEDKKAKQKLRIKTRKAYIDIVNYVRAVTNDMPISEDVDIDTIVSEKESADNSVNLMESIKREATDDWDFNALNETGALKDAVEIAHEQSINYYFGTCGFKENIAHLLVSDFMKVNMACYRFYTSVYTGLPQVQYIDLPYLNTSVFSKRDGSDMDFWWFTQPVTWSQWMDMVGGNLSDEENLRVYEANRIFATNVTNYPLFNKSNFPSGNAYLSNQTLLQTTIVLGYFEAKKRNFKDPKTGNHYDVIRKFYYLPLGINTDGSTSKRNGIEFGAEFIFDLGNLQDQHRKGTKLRECDFSLITWRDITRQSFYDVQQSDFLRLNLLYNQYLNTLANFFPEGVGIAEETISELAEQLQAEEEEYMKQRGDTASAQSLQKFRSDIIRGFIQTGRGVFKMRKGDNNEMPLDRPIFPLENKIMLNLSQIMQEMFSVYNHLLMSLGINQNRLAQDPKPRQAVSGIESATQASYFSTQNLEDFYQFMLKQFGTRMLYYNQNVITEFNEKGEPTTDRAKELQSLLGNKGIIPLEVYSYMPFQRCILRVVNLPTAQERLQLMAICAQYEQQGVVPAGTLLIAQEIQNFKLAKLYIIFSIRKQKREMIENQQAMQQQQAEAMKQAQQAQTQAEAMKVQQEKDLEARNEGLNNKAKTEGQLEVKDATKNSKIAEQQNKTALSLQEEAAKKELENL